MVIRESVLVVLMVVITGADCDVTGGSESWFPGTCYLVYLWFMLGFKGLHPKLGGGSQVRFLLAFFFVSWASEFIFIMVTASGAVAQWELGVLSD